jgi:hypothetical protein
MNAMIGWLLLKFCQLQADDEILSAAKKYGTVNTMPPGYESEGLKPKSAISSYI